MAAKKDWVIRRHMAVGAYIAGVLLFPIAYMIEPKLKDIAIPYYTFITFLLTSYYAWVTIQDMKEKKEVGQDGPD